MPSVTDERRAIVEAVLAEGAACKECAMYCDAEEVMCDLLAGRAGPFDARLCPGFSDAD